MGAHLNGNGAHRGTAPDPLSAAAALRWYLSRAEAGEAQPDEYLEYQGADLALAYLEATYPGLEEFLHRLDAVARLAAGLSLARKAEVPEAALTEMQADFEARWLDLGPMRDAISCEDSHALLRAYGYVADAAHVLNR